SLPCLPTASARRGHFTPICLAFPRCPNPPNLAKRGGCWFERGALKLPLGVERDFRPARKAHPAFLVEDLAQLAQRLGRAGQRTRPEEPLAGYIRFYVDVPFGTPIDLMEPLPAGRL